MTASALAMPRSTDVDSVDLFVELTRMLLSGRSSGVTALPHDQTESAAQHRRSTCGPVDSSDHLPVRIASMDCSAADVSAHVSAYLYNNMLVWRP